MYVYAHEFVPRDIRLDMLNLKKWVYIYNEKTLKLVRFLQTPKQGAAVLAPRGTFVAIGSYFHFFIFSYFPTFFDSLIFIFYPRAS